MTDSSTLTDRAIASLRTLHDRLEALVAGFDDDQLIGPSGASDWRTCDVLSHLGSGAEITAKPLFAAVAGTAPAASDNQAVWARWDAASPREQAEWFVRHDATVVSTLEGLDADRRATLLVDLGFLPEPVPLVVAVGMRLNEVAQHAWDVEAGLDESAVLDAEAADVLVDLYAGPLGFLLGFTSKPDVLTERTVVAFAGHSLVVDDAVSVVEGVEAATATFSGEPEAVVRLIGGRLTPSHTPPGVEVTGDVSLDDLRRVFPGF